MYNQHFEQLEIIRSLEKCPFNNVKAFMSRDLAGHHTHSDKTIELNGRSQNNTRYRAFPVPSCAFISHSTCWYGDLSHRGSSAI